MAGCGVGVFPTFDAAVAGTIAFAYKAEASLVQPLNGHTLFHWLALQWCFLLTQHMDGTQTLKSPGVQRPLNDAKLLAPTPEVAHIMHSAFTRRMPDVAAAKLVQPPEPEQDS